VKRKVVVQDDVHDFVDGDNLDPKSTVASKRVEVNPGRLRRTLD
jgi:hypothetical protein